GGGGRGGGRRGGPAGGGVKDSTPGGPDRLSSGAPPPAVRGAAVALRLRGGRVMGRVARQLPSEAPARLRGTSSRRRGEGHHVRERRALSTFGPLKPLCPPDPRAQSRRWRPRESPSAPAARGRGRHGG